MAQVKPCVASSSLKKKGFVEEKDSDHIYYRFVNPYTGMKTKIRTKISHNSKPLGNVLLVYMKRQLHFISKKDLVDFLVCNIDRDEYCRILASQGLI